MKEPFFLVPSEFEASSLSGLDVKYGLTGIGLVEASLTSILLFQKQPNQRFVLIGWAGGYPDTGLKEGDIVIASKEVWVDFGRRHKDRYEGLPDKLKVRREIEFNPVLIERVENLLKTKGFRPIVGPMATVCATSYDPERSLFFRKEFNVVAENMEGFGVAKAAETFKVDLLEIRVISNLLESPEKPWDFQFASKVLREVVLCLKKL
ncbi:MAG: futalosine hydrolase [Thermodesulfobacterium sp.]|nr:futalosine hydrolase [Thermodesulfobacterium sp.]